MSSYKIVDLFAGIGRMRRGFEKTQRYASVLAAENDKYDCLAYGHIFGENPFNDVTTSKFKEKIAQVACDFLLAGFPCQAFSIAGKKQVLLIKLGEPCFSIFVN